MTTYFSGILNGKQITITHAQANEITKIAHAGGGTGQPVFKIVHNETKLLIDYDGKWFPNELTAKRMADVLGANVQATDIVWHE